MFSIPVVVNSVGLVLDIIGVILLFFCGLPPEGVSRTGANYLTWGTDSRAREKGKRFAFLSWVALALLVTGFGLQILSSFISSP